MSLGRKPVIAGNWKLNKTVKESIELVTLLKRSISDDVHTEIIVCPPFTAINAVAEVLMESPIRVGAQDVYWEEKGAFTGEISASLLKEAGAAFIIVGHSERRQFFHETDQTVNRKTKAVLKAGLTPIVCVGETLAEREAAKTLEVLKTQITGSLEGLNSQEIQKCIIAYEPVWAIGTGKVATCAQAQEAHDFIRKQIGTLFGASAASAVR
ncbi:MAG: triose-phosphate isomerase, partial [Candidatus Omnitrophota bacterium]